MLYLRGQAFRGCLFRVGGRREIVRINADLLCRLSPADRQPASAVSLSFLIPIDLPKPKLSNFSPCQPLAHTARQPAANSPRP